MAEVKGNAVIGQSGGPTAVINQSLVGVIRQAETASAIENVYGSLHGIKGMMEDNLIDLLAEPVARLEKVAGTPCSALRSVRHKPSDDDCAQVLANFKKRNIRYFFYIGGNDSAETAHILNEMAGREGYELKAFHVPKTIDNDLRVTDHCPGFGTAARFVACAFMGDNLDNRAIPGVMIGVVMGRHAGFLTAAAALGRRYEDDGPHLIYLPERPLSIEQFVGDVSDVYAKHGRCIVAVSEGVHNADGSPLIDLGEKDSHGNIQLSGSGALGDFLADAVKKELGKTIKKPRVRADTFGYLQRSFPGCVSAVDSAEARRAGEDAVVFALGEEMSGSVAFRRVGDGADYAIDTFLTPLSTVAKDTREMPDEHIAENNHDVTQAFIDYASPLTDELPVVERLEDHKV